jgi:hypothetical protein
MRPEGNSHAVAHLHKQNRERAAKTRMPHKRECAQTEGHALSYSEPGVARPRYPRDTNNQTQRTLLRSMFKSRIYAKNVKRPANNVTIAHVKKLLQKRQVLIPQIIAERQIAFAC